MYTHTHTI